MMKTSYRSKPVAVKEQLLSQTVGSTAVPFRESPTKGQYRQRSQRSKDPLDDMRRVLLQGSVKSHRETGALASLQESKSKWVNPARTFRLERSTFSELKPGPKTSESTYYTERLTGAMNTPVSSNDFVKKLSLKLLRKTPRPEVQR